MGQTKIKITLIFRVLLISTLSSLALFSCSCDDDNPPPPNPAEGSTWGEMKWGEGTWGKKS